jgi:hypothetical protein
MDYTKDRIARHQERVRPQGDSPAEQLVKFKHHKAANGILNFYIDKCDYLAAYTVAFSLLEDRVRATAIVKKRDLLKSNDYEKFVTEKLGRVADFLYAQSPSHSIFLENLKTVFFNWRLTDAERNRQVHADAASQTYFSRDSVPSTPPSDGPKK